MNTGELKANIEMCTGSENWYKHFTGMLYTDGIQMVAEKAGAYWFIDVVASYQSTLKNIPFQLWILTVDDNKAVVTAHEDVGEEVLVMQEISYTDFPKGVWKFYVIDGTMLLPQEY